MSETKEVQFLQIEVDTAGESTLNRKQIAFNTDNGDLSYYGTSGVDHYTREGGDASYNSGVFTGASTASSQGDFIVDSNSVRQSNYAPAPGSPGSGITIDRFGIELNNQGGSGPYWSETVNLGIDAGLWGSTLSSDATIASLSGAPDSGIITKGYLEAYVQEETVNKIEASDIFVVSTFDELKTALETTTTTNSKQIRVIEGITVPATNPTITPIGSNIVEGRGIILDDLTINLTSGDVKFKNELFVVSNVTVSMSAVGAFYSTKIGGNQTLTVSGSGGMYYEYSTAILSGNTVQQFWDNTNGAEPITGESDAANALRGTLDKSALMSYGGYEETLSGLTITPSASVGSFAADTWTIYNETVTGAVVGDNVIIQPDGPLYAKILSSNVGFDAIGWVSSANTVDFAVRPTGGSILSITTEGFIVSVIRS